jgi:hypothetical protein
MHSAKPGKLWAARESPCGCRHHNRSATPDLLHQSQGFAKYREARHDLKRKNHNGSHNHTRRVLRQNPTIFQMLDQLAGSCHNNVGTFFQFRDLLLHVATRQVNDCESSPKAQSHTEPHRRKRTTQSHLCIARRSNMSNP